MLDLQIILDQPDKLKSMLHKRAWDANKQGSGFDIERLQQIITENKKLSGQVQEAQHKRNYLSKEIGRLMAKDQQIKNKQDRVQTKKEEVKKISVTINYLEKQKAEVVASLTDMAATLPNWLDDEVPQGGEDANVILREYKPPASVSGEGQFSFSPRTHYELGESRGLLDFNRGVKLAGSRFYTYWGMLARLERSLIQFMLNLHTHCGYTEVFVPMLVDDQAMFTTGQFPKFRGEYYSLERDGLSLIPTAEVPLVNLYRDEIIAEDELPVALTAASSCFRREAGAAGKDTRGLVRVHQFQKVELVQIVHPQESERLHQEMLSQAEKILEQLELPYRVVLKAAGDTGSTAAKSYDLEVWMPGLNRWLEISSVSNCLDYQARRGKIRYKAKQKGSKTNFVHTLNGSGVAAGRCMIAIMENYQKEDMSFDLPLVLKKYFNN